MNILKKYLALFEVVRYTREDGNEAIYKVFRPSKNVLTKKGDVVGFKAWKLSNSGVNEDPGWRSFRFDRIKKSELVFA